MKQNRTISQKEKHKHIWINHPYANILICQICDKHKYSRKKKICNDCGHTNVLKGDNNEYD